MAQIGRQGDEVPGDHAALGAAFLGRMAAGLDIAHVQVGVDETGAFTYQF